MDRQEFIERLEKCLEGTATPAEERLVVDEAGQKDDFAQILFQALAFDSSLDALTHDEDALPSGQVTAWRR